MTFIEKKSLILALATNLNEVANMSLLAQATRIGWFLLGSVQF